jgi:uncharacterized protein YecT (DUF1311 family)
MLKNKVWSVVLFIMISMILILSTSSPQAMSFSIVNAKNGKDTVVKAEGKIEYGDSEKFIQLIQATPPSFKLLNIKSPGGSVRAAIDLANEIERRNYHVRVIEECASACSQIIFPAGLTSTMQVGSVIGVHSCSRGGVRDDICNDEIAELAVKRGFPYGTLAMYADRYDPSDMKWLTEIGARCFGFYHDIGDPLPIYGEKPCVDGIIYTLNKNISTRPFGPSFDCQKAFNKVEKLLCMDKELMFLDSVLGRAFDAKIKFIGNAEKKNIIQQQRSWIDERNEKCSILIPDNMNFIETRSAALCLYKYNSKRVYQLIGKTNNL